MKRSFKGSIMLNPVPVVLVTCRNREGKENVFTVAWTGTVCSKPPMISISVRPERLSYDYIKETGEFTINLPAKSMVKAVDYCGVRSGRQENKIEKMGFSMREGVEIKSPSIEDCPINMECKVKQVIPLGTHDVFLAEVLSCFVEERLIDKENKIHFEEADLIAYSHGEYFPIVKKPIGRFGYSVRKKKRKK